MEEAAQSARQVFIDRTTGDLHIEERLEKQDHDDTEGDRNPHHALVAVTHAPDEDGHEHHGNRQIADDRHEDHVKQEPQHPFDGEEPDLPFDHIGAHEFATGQFPEMQASEQDHASDGDHGPETGLGKELGPFHPLGLIAKLRQQQDGRHEKHNGKEDLAAKGAGEAFFFKRTHLDQAPDTGRAGGICTSGPIFEVRITRGYPRSLRRLPCPWR